MQNVTMWTVVVCKGDCGLLSFDVIGGYPTLLLTIDTPPHMEVHFSCGQESCISIETGEVRGL